MKRSEKGFTLIELIVVIALVAIFFSFAIPKLGDVTEADLRRNIRHLTGTISYLRDEAMMKKREFRLNYNIAMNEYWATEVVKSGTQAEVKRLETVFVNKNRLHGDIRFKDIVILGHQGSVEEFFTQFYPNGWVEKTVIHLQKGEDKHYTLIVMPLTGKVKVYEGYIEER
ncbi:MAG: prepilin-type N-terminal cleavage/methylation domain-containing protein [Nitrospirota bacterium]